MSSPNPLHSPVPCQASDSEGDSTEKLDSLFSSSQLPYQPLRSSSSCEPQNTEDKINPLPSSPSVSADFPPYIPPPPPPPNVRGKRGRGIPRGACSGRSRPNRNVSSTRSNSSSQLMRAKNTTNNFPFDLNLSALNPFPALPTSSQPEGGEISSPLQRKLDERAVFRIAI